MKDGLLFVAVFFACLVEAVEALTIVLAVGVTRGWRSAILGLLAALAALVAVVAALGPALKEIPLGALQLVVGGLLLIFGLQWLRKAILRAAGVKAKHDEAAIYKEEVAAAETAARGNEAVDWYSFRIAFMGVLLEGLEVAFIVLTFGTTQHNVPLASIAAAAAILVVTGVGFAVRAPLARVPENTLKYAVGLMLTTFGTFWGAEGAGAHWPGGDAAIPVLLAAYAVVSLGTVQLIRRQLSAPPAVPVTGAEARRDLVADRTQP